MRLECFIGNIFEFFMINIAWPTDSYEYDEELIEFLPF
jgi:hypothetical protein